MRMLFPPLPLSAAPPQQRKISHLPALDGLRGLAILLVIVYHAASVPPEGMLPEGSLLNVWSAGTSWLWSGVDLFFVLSGFLITRILITTRDDPGYFSKFYVRRMLRIFPLYYGVLVALFIVAPLLAFSFGAVTSATAGEAYQKLVAHQAWLWTYTHNFLQARGESQLPGLGHLWSLAVEEQFYLVWPVVIYFLSGRRLAIFCFALCMATFALRIALLQSGVAPWALFHWTFTRCDSLAWGALAATISLNSQASYLADRYAKWIGWGALAGLLGCGLWNDGIGHIGWEKLSLPMQSFGFTLLGLLYAVIVLRASRPECQSTGWLTVLPLRTLGKYSYAMYVFHWPLCRFSEMLCRGMGLPLSGAPHDLVICRLMELTIVLSLSFAAAWLSWHLWESRWLQLKRYWAYE